MKKTFKKFVSVALSVMLCAAAVPASFVASNAAGGGTVTPKVAASYRYTVVLKSDGTVWATGQNKYGELGVNNAVEPKEFESSYTATFIQCVDADGPIQDAKDVACGGDHTAIIRGDNNEIWQCGSNKYGQLGNNSTDSSAVFVKSSSITGATQIACGGKHTAVILENGEVWQCGSNQYGQLSNTTVSSGSGKYSKVFVKSSKYTNGSSGDTEAITGAAGIACGIGHTAVIINGEVWQCGNNDYGQLGNNSTDSSTVFVKSSSITGAKQVACGGYHTAVLLENGEVWQCGDNQYGQLGNLLVYISSGTSKKSTVFVKSSRENTEEITGATQIACGTGHTAVIINGEVWQCGWNIQGQLGNNGDKTVSLEFVKSSNITNAKEISTGCQAVHTMVLCAEEGGTYTLYGVGYNNSGQLGLGDAAGTADVLTFTESTTIGDIGAYIVPDIEAIAALGESSSRKVTGVGQFVNTYRLDVEWSDLQYTYTAEWNIEDSKWVGAWEAADGGDQIVVKNGSATPCKVEFDFGTNDEFKSPSDGEPGTKGTFADPKVTDEPALDTTTNTVPLAVYTTATPATSQKTVKLGIEGIPNSKAGTNIADATTVGNVTITLKNANS